MTTIGKKSCPTCGQSINPRKIALFGGMVQSLWRVWKYCKEKNIEKFTRKQIKHLILTDNEIARFGDWIYFGLVDKPRKGEYKLRMEYVDKFFQGRVVVPKYVWKDPVTKKVVWPKDRRDFATVLEVPQLGTLLDELGGYVAEYKKTQQLSLELK